MTALDPGQDTSAEEQHAVGQGRHAGHGPHGFGGVVGWTIVGAVAPGAGLLAAGRRRAGFVVLTLAGLLAVGVVVAALTVDPVTLMRRMLTDPDRLVTAAWVLAAVTVAWAVVVVVTHLSLCRVADLTTPQRTLGTVLVVALIGLIAVPAAAVGNDALAARRTLNSLFGNSATQLHHDTPQAAAADPWAGVPRVNVLLLGGDAGADRTGVRPDTMIVASIDTATGETVLVSLPRNLQRVPFPAGSPGAAEFPNGFWCLNAQGENTECLLNGLWTWAESHPQDYPGDAHPGLTATIQGAQEVTGLHIDDEVMLNLQGFQQFVDILGGLEVNVTERLPVGGNAEHPVASRWLEPGRQKLSGYLALWYARSRWSTTDYDRMRRQRCVIGDLVQQADPVTLALRFDQVASTLRQNLQTSIPLADLDAWVTLAQRVKKSHVRSLAFTDQVINTSHPDIAAMHALVQQATTGTASATSPGPSSPGPSSPGPSSPGPSSPGPSSPGPTSPTSPGPTSPGLTGTPTPTRSPVQTPPPTQAQDLSQVC